LADVVDFADRMHFGEAPAAKAEYEALLAIESHVRAAFAGWQGRSKDLLDQLDKVRNG
jgi:FtsZ-binding cell division protein ZapB